MKQNVLHLINSFNQGGSERQAVQLIRLLDETGRYNLKIACINREGVLMKEIEDLGFKDIHEFRLGSFYDRNFIRQLRSLSRHLRKREISIIQTHDFYSNILGMFAASLARTPVRIAAKRETGSMRTRAQSFVERRAFAVANAIVVNADAVKRHLISDGIPEKKIVTVYNGLDIGRLTLKQNLSREEILTSLNLPTGKEKRFITIVANLRHHVKDIPTFLRSARKVSEAFADSVFVVAGEGELTDEMKSLTRELEIEKKVFFMGRCESVPELLSASDVCVLSSKNEGFSNSILEYMAAAKPVVATDVGGAREAIMEGETGFTVSVGDDEKMAARIISLLEDKEKAETMGKRGKERVVKEFSCAAQLEKTEQLYERLFLLCGDAKSKVQAIS